MNRHRMRILADILDGIADHDGAPSPHDPPGFAMSSFYQPGTTFYGATACLAGHAILAFGTPEQCNTLRSLNSNAAQTAAELLDLPPFTPLWYLWSLGRNSRAAALLLRDLATLPDAESEQFLHCPAALGERAAAAIDAAGP